MKKNKPSREKDKPKQHILKKKEEASKRPVEHFLKYLSRKTFLSRAVTTYQDGRRQLQWFVFHPIKGRKGSSGVKLDHLIAEIAYEEHVYQWALYPIAARPDSPEFEAELESLKKRLSWHDELETSTKVIEVLISSTKPGIEEP